MVDKVDRVDRVLYKLYLSFKGSLITSIRLYIVLENTFKLGYNIIIIAIIKGGFYFSFKLALEALG